MLAALSKPPRVSGGVLRDVDRGWAVLCLAIAMCTQDYRPTFIDAATYSYQLDVISWELANLPDKWFRRLFRNPASWFGNDNSDQIIVEVEQYFAYAAWLSSADVRLVTLLTDDTLDPETP